MERDKETTFIGVLLTSLTTLLGISSANKYGLTTIISQLVFFAVFMYLIHKPIHALLGSLKDFSFRIPRRNSVLAIVKKNKNKPKKMSLTAEPLGQQDNRLDLRIHNNEKDDITIQEAYIGHKDGLPEQSEPRWSKISRSPNIVVEAGNSRVVSFILKHANFNKFTVYDYAPDEHSIYGYFQYEPGVHKFDVKILYDSKEQRVNGLVKWFSITVTYDAPSHFTIDIEHADKKHL